MLIKVGLCHYSVYAKPDKEKGEGYLFGKYREDANSGWGEYEIEEVAKLTGDQATPFLPGHLVGGTTSVCCSEQQLFALDFDNNITSDKAIYKCREYDLEPCFMYHTLRNGLEGMGERFRMVFVAEKTIQGVFLIKLIIQMLRRLFPESDKQCTDLSRVFLGGKDLFYLDINARLDLVKLVNLVKYNLGKDGNAVRDTQIFCKSADLMVYKNLPLMGALSELDLISDEFMDPTINEYIYKIESINSSIFAIRKNTISLNHQSQKCHDAKAYIRIEHEYIKKNCLLVSSFLSGTLFSHSVRFGLLLNLLHIRGGEKLFFQALCKYYPEDTCTKWRTDVKYMKKWDYKPQRCEAYCPFFETCQNEGTLIQAVMQDHKVFQSNGNEEYVSIEEAYTQLLTNIKEAIYSSVQGIHIIKAQTGLGKTEAYIRTIAGTREKAFVVAFPTNITREEGRKRLLAIGVSEEDIFSTPTVRNNPFVPPTIQQEIIQLHEKGIHNRTNMLIREYLQELDPGSVKQRAELQAIINGMKAYSGQRIILTTHAYLLQLGDQYLSGKTVIIDEDILHQALNITHEVSEDGLKMLIKYDIDGYSKIAKIMLNSPVGKYLTIGDIRNNALSTEELSALSDYGYEGNINDLWRAKAFVRKREKGEKSSRFLYYCPMVLPCSKVIILSATANESIYRRYYKDREVMSYPQLKVQYRGKLNQYTRHSLGRSDLKRKSEAFVFAKAFFNGKDPIYISFKKFTNIMVKEEPIRLDKHYGNSMGIDEYAGKNIAVIGTPFHHPDAEKLAAVYLGADVNSKTNLRPERRRIIYNGYSFVIPTYEDEVLREIQLYGIQTEIEQSVGRARLLRYDCEVLVLSSFPCEQAIFHTEDYLEANSKES